MKTVLIIDASGSRYFRHHRGQWLKIDRPDDKASLHVIADLPEETLEGVELPMLFGRDRAHFLQRHLSTAFPNSPFRNAISTSLFRPGTALLTGLTTAETIERELNKLKNPVAGVWGMFMLLMLVMRSLRIDNVILVFPEAQYLRILVIRHATPVITRCIHRYNEKESDAGEIERTRQHLENHRVFEQEAIPPVLYLGDPASSGISPSELMPLPDAMRPKGDASYLHALLEKIASSPKGQIAPMPFRVRHLALHLRKAAYILTASCLLTGALFSVQDLRALSGFNAIEALLQKSMQQETARRQHLAILIRQSGTDPALMRKAAQFAAQEIDAAPAPASFFRFVAAGIAGLQEVRIKSLRYRLLKPGESYCQKAPLATDIRLAQLQFSILFTEPLSAAQQAGIRKRISDNLLRNASVQLIENPAAPGSRAIQGGMGAANTEDVWCMAIPWQTLR
jgi:hypothetical protein